MGMDWRGRRGSGNIEDRRRMGGGGIRAGGVGGVGVVAVLLIGWFLGVDLTPILQDGGMGTSTPSAPVELTAEDRAAGEFVSVTLADTEEVWGAVFPQQVGQPYTAPTLVLFKGGTQSPCGGANGASGPFYCPIDGKAYLDTEFFTTMDRQLGAGGDFAAAYVIAHEIAHHVQNELGILEQTTRMRQQVSGTEGNEISVRVELMADCLAGLWAREAGQRFGSLERGDIEEAVNAARQIGDDTLQRNAGQRPNPHTFTHGTSEQRSRWFLTGYDTGLIESCDTFATDRL
jgi:predicted metalloprotease